jgi:outer membrane protein TolC
VLKIIDVKQKTLKRQLLSFKNEFQAKLDLNLGLSSEGENTNYSSSLENQSPTWNVGLGLSYPLGGIKSSSNIKKAQIKLARLMQNKQEQLLELSVQATTLKEKINLLAQMLKSNKKQISIAKERTIEERDRYSNGSGQASFVINAQNNEQNAQLSYVQVATSYQKSVLEYRATLDQLAR